MLDHCGLRANWASGSLITMYWRKKFLNLHFKTTFIANDQFFGKLWPSDWIFNASKLSWIWENSTSTKERFKKLIIHIRVSKNFFSYFGRPNEHCPSVLDTRAVKNVSRISSFKSNNFPKSSLILKPSKLSLMFTTSRKMSHFQ